MRTCLDPHPVGVLIIFSRLFAAPRYNVLPMVQSRANVNLQRSEAVPHRAHTMSSQLYPTVFAEHNHSARTYFPATANFSVGVRVCAFQIVLGQAGWSGLKMRRSDLVQHKEKEKATNTRTSQIVFGERQHLLRVLDSLEGTDLPLPRAQQERRALEELIHARTRELNEINTAWDEKIGLVLSADAKPEMLEKLVKQAPESDYYLLRLISEHPRSNAKTLQKLGRHPYGA